MKRAITFLNEQGDVSITWTEEQDKKMIAFIQKKMDQGITFFIVEPRAYGLLNPKRTKLTEPTKALKHRALSIGDEDFAKFVESGKVEIEPTPDGKVKTVEKSTDAEKVAKSQSVAVKPIKGG